MPLYEYKCDACGARFERIRKFSDPPLEECPVCGKGPVEKLVSSPAFQFKGSGFYATDYGRKPESTGSGDPAPAAKSEKSEKSEKAEKTGKSEKTESSTKDAGSGKDKDTKAGEKSAPATTSTKDS